MSFHLSSDETTLRIENNHMLKGRLRNSNGELCDSEISLDKVLGNDDGRFQWDGEGFSGSAENVRFAIEGGGAVPVLRADLRDSEGNLCAADVNLAERIQNCDGQFTFERPLRA
ncbi:Cyanovirin-N [Wilcoxina mikolae CBS 423.85]|nr:Cyanovirin-N [Wilcoxina mikolae CBS 423.85]